jgi:hypothetical protein
MAHRVGREFLEHAHQGKLPGDTHADDAHRRSFALTSFGEFATVASARQPGSARGPGTGA